MKKLLVVLSLAMAAISFQANAATISWVGATPGSTAGSTTQTLFGTVGGLTAPTAVNDTWTFSLSDVSLVKIGVTSLPSWLSSVTFSGGALAFTDLAPTAGVWTFTGLLMAGQYTINLIGDAVDSSGYQIRVETPIPAAVWLFGSALMGLTGISRRKAAKA